MGLLNRTLLLVKEEACSDIISLVKNHHFSAACILHCFDSKYCITDSYNFDEQSVLKSLSTEDFWNGTVTEKETWLCLNKNDSDFSSFRQFYSDKMLDSFEYLSIYLTNHSKIYTVCSKEKPDFTSLENEFDNCSIKNQAIPQTEFDFGKFYHVLNINIEEAVTTLLIQYSITEFEDELSMALENMLYNRLKAYAGKPNFCQKNDKFNFLLFMYTDKDFPQELFYTHITTELSKLLDEGSELLSIKKIGEAKSNEELKQFCQAE